MTSRMPVVFFGHGTPLNALTENQYTRGWAAMAKAIRKPRAILSISAHWYVAGIAVTAMERPETLKDFGYTNMDHLEYPAPGDPALARRVADLLAPQLVIQAKTEWGFDHGTWSVLLKAYPAADIPVVQLSIDGRLPPHIHFALARKLAPLRDDDVLIMGTGNIVHNLGRTIRTSDAKPYPWAERFDTTVRDMLASGDWDALIDYEKLGSDAMESVPTPDHYLPLVYAMGAADRATDAVTFPVEGVAMGSMSMRSVMFAAR